MDKILYLLKEIIKNELSSFIISEVGKNIEKIPYIDTKLLKKSICIQINMFPTLMSGTLSIAFDNLVENKTAKAI